MITCTLFTRRILPPSEKFPSFSTTAKFETTRLFGKTCGRRVRECIPLYATSSPRSRDELFVEQLTETFTPPEITTLQNKIQDLTKELDQEYKSLFSGREVEVDEEKIEVGEMDVERFSQLGKDRPVVMKALLDHVSTEDAESWRLFQAKVQDLKLKRSRFEKQLETARYEIVERERKAVSSEDELKAVPLQEGELNLVLVTGFESFNSQLYTKVAKDIAKKLEGVRMLVFNDQDIERRSKELEAALKEANVLFASLIVDYEQAMWLLDRSSHIPTRFVFESALELMSLTKVGTFSMASRGKSQGAPPIVKKLLSLFGSKKEEDRMLGYLSFLKIGPKILKFIPGSRAHDLQTWLMVYNYWTQGGPQNIFNMVKYMSQRLQGSTGVIPEKPMETPNTGCVHPDHQGVFTTPKAYLQWYEKEGKLGGRKEIPTVGILLYRKHVITGQTYINDLIRVFEEEGLRPLPVFITGIEAHTVVRDLFTSTTEQQRISTGLQQRDSLSVDAVEVEAVVNTIGFPLVGGPAGSMEAGRQADIAQSILVSKNIPYLVAAPLLVQNLDSWMQDGVAGLQSVVLYSLPELDGAVDTVPLGGLVGENIFLVPERVQKLTARVKNWIQLRRKPKQERKIALLLYGFPPGVGSIGTAALLNVPKSLQALLLALKDQGYDVGNLSKEVDGESLIKALKRQDDQGVVFKGVAGVETAGVGTAEASGVQTAAAEVTPKRLKESLTYPLSWGPSEWGPIPFLPEEDVLLKKLENQWGELTRYRGISTAGNGNLLVSGLQFGNVWIGVQPLLGVEGDPMRLLFERDLTPHPQYIAYYKWLQEEFCADAVLHFGMHGTVEWLPGAPLGNTGLSWSDVLLGNMPNVYLYACNNPSESIIAKRRGYGTIISHNVPPYGRAGLYKQLAELKSLLNEAREGQEIGTGLRESIVSLLEASGLSEDCPFQHPDSQSSVEFQLTVDTVNTVPNELFKEYISNLYQYLMVLENRLYSEGLHVLGKEPSSEEMERYLEAYFGVDLPSEVLTDIASSDGYQLPQDSMDSTHQNKIKEALQIRDLLLQNSEEMKGIMRALNGEYIQPAPGGDLLRDGAGVLPTGRNIFALDPYRMPSPSAMDRGQKVAEAILQQHLEEQGSYPETVAVNLWGLDSIKTKGESVGIVLTLVGAKPLQEGTGRIARYELVPLEELGGRPRIDCLCHMSGIFRDSFQNVVELLDDLFKRAAEAEEPPEMNYIKKHAAEMEVDGIEGKNSRLFSNPAGDFGSMVNERVGTSDWTSNQELGSTWASRNSFAYGRGEKGEARPEVLQTLLKSTSQVVQEIDSVEYGLTDIQEYYANTGALVRAIKNVRGEESVDCRVVETFSKEVRPQKLDQVLRMEYRTKLLNPRWAKAMAAQGSGGAFEISQRMTAMIGWGATTDFQEDWSWDQAANTYALDPEMAKILRESNPQAFRNVVRRMLEAAGRGFWKTNEETMEKLRELYTDIEDELEDLGSIDVSTDHEVRSNKSDMDWRVSSDDGISEEAWNSGTTGGESEPESVDYERTKRRKVEPKVLPPRPDNAMTRKLRPQKVLTPESVPVEQPGPSISPAVANPRTELKRELSAEEEIEELKRIKEMWEMNVVFDFLNLFQEQLQILDLVSMDEIEKEIVRSNGQGRLTHLHTGLLKGLRPKMKVNESNWAVILAKKFRSEDLEDNPFDPVPGNEFEEYCHAPTVKRVFALKLLCELRCCENDIRELIQEAIKPQRIIENLSRKRKKMERLKVSHFRKTPIGQLSSTILFWLIEATDVLEFRLYKETREYKKKGKKTPAYTKLVGWELIASNYDQLCEFAENLGKTGSHTKNLRRRLFNEILPHFEERIEKEEKRRRLAERRKQHESTIILDQYGGYGSEGVRSVRARTEAKYTFEEYDRTMAEAIDDGMYLDKEQGTMRADLKLLSPQPAFSLLNEVHNGCNNNEAVENDLPENNTNQMDF